MDTYTWMCQFSLTCVNIGCSLEDLQVVMDGRDGWRETVKEIYVVSATKNDFWN